MVVGDPDFQGWALQLPGARVEAQEVRRQLLSSSRFGDRVTRLIGREATKPAVCDAMEGSEAIEASF